MSYESSSLPRPGVPDPERPVFPKPPAPHGASQATYSLVQGPSSSLMVGPSTCVMAPALLSAEHTVGAQNNESQRGTS